ncbi:hypothetical protein NQ663_21355 [Acinetobacter baumannii]|nr:hypothetical protein [Acinetobacter baumannii]
MNHSNIAIETQSIALRAYAVNASKTISKKYSPKNLDVSSEWAIVFDC